MVEGKLPSYKIYEDKDFLAILDIYPNIRGMTLVLTKKHYPSYVLNMPENVYKKLLLVTRKIAKHLDKKLKVKRTAIVMEGMGINHAHIKLYPLHGIKKNFVEMWHPKRVYFKKYEGYINTQLGPRAKEKELQKIVKILSKNS